MNVSILIHSLRFISKNYNLLVSLSTWIDDCLKEKQLTEAKFSKIKRDQKTLASVIQVVNQDILQNYIIKADYEYFMNAFHNEYFIKALIDNIADIDFNNQYLLRISASSNYYHLVELLLKRGAKINNVALNYTGFVMFNSHKSVSKQIIRVLLKYGAVPDMDYITENRSAGFIQLLEEVLSENIID